MKVSENFSLRDIAGEHVVVPIGEAASQIYGIMTLNDSGLLLWNLLKQDCREEDLTAALLAEYEVDEQTASRDVRTFLDRLRQVGILEE